MQQHQYYAIKKYIKKYADTILLKIFPVSTRSREDSQIHIRC